MPATKCSRILIEDVYPELNAGCFPVTRIVGDTLAVSADILGMDMTCRRGWTWTTGRRS